MVLTSSREEQDVVESYRLGVNSYIVKPVELREEAGNIPRAARRLGLSRSGLCRKLKRQEPEA